MNDIRKDETVKVIFSSGYSRDHEAVQGTGCSQHPFIQKPFDIVKLSRKLREVLEG